MTTCSASTEIIYTSDLDNADEKTSMQNHKLQVAIKDCIGVIPIELFLPKFIIYYIFESM